MVGWGRERVIHLVYELVRELGRELGKHSRDDIQETARRTSGTGIEGGSGEFKEEV